MPPVPPPAFLDHQPVALAFGTSGLRGLVKDITDLEAYINVRGALAYLIGEGDCRPGGCVIMGGDLRPSTPRILRACAQAVIDADLAIENAGRVPTPALTLRSLATASPGVMVTGSHIPFDRNGIKVNRSVGEVLKSDEAGILREVERVRREEYGKSAAESRFDASGMFDRPPDLPWLDAAAEEGYVRRYVTAFGGDALAGQVVLVYQHSAVGRDLVPRVLEALGATVVPVGRSETFIPIDTENVTAAQVAQLSRLVVEAGVAGCTALVSTDGDSDRPLVAAVLPDGSSRRLRVLPGDLLGLVVAEELGVDAAVVPVSASDAVERRLGERGVTLRRCRIGSPHVIAEMDRLRREEGARRVVGWEANGGFLVGTPLPVEGRTIEPLPTRDALLPILVNLRAAARRGVTLDELWRALPARHGASGLLDEVPVAASRAALARLIPAGSPIEVGFRPDGGVVDLGAPGHPLVAPDVAEAWRASRAALSVLFDGSRGFGALARANVLDGLRLFFASGDVAHVRPSGNAPQLRIYAVADSEERAAAIVDLALAEPDGILRRLVAEGA